MTSPVAAWGGRIQRSDDGIKVAVLQRDAGGEGIEDGAGLAAKLIPVGVDPLGSPFRVIGGESVGDMAGFVDESLRELTECGIAT